MMLLWDNVPGELRGALLELRFRPPRQYQWRRMEHEGSAI
jgi:hypothetical protein